MKSGTLLATMLMLVVLSVLGFSSTGDATAQGGSRTFPETGHTVSGQFLDYWNTHGGLAQQGYPISDELQEVSATDGKQYAVQYFERAVFEKHPENQPPDDVLLSLLGVFLYQQKYPAGAPNQTPNNEANSHLFTETGHRVGGLFLNYWQTHGALAQQGYPISEEFNERSDLGGKSYKVQYFQRAVFEYHPENTAQYNVLLSQLGTFQYRAVYGNGSSAGGGGTVPPAVTPTVAPAPVSQAGGQYVATASVDKPTPTNNSYVTVTGRLTRGDQGVGGVTMDTIWHYKTTTSGCTGTTDASGTASCTRDISRATAGYTVVIDVVFTLPNGGTVSTSTSFTPR